MTAKRKRNVAAVDFGLLTLLVVLLAGCQSTQAPVLPPVPEVNLNTTDVGEIDVSAELGEMGMFAEVDSELSFSTLDKQLDKTNRTIAVQPSHQLPKELINRQICKNQVEVSYRVPNQDGYENTFLAHVQLQARLKGVSEDRMSIKVQLKGWYTDNKNLRQWLPSMKRLPFYPEFPLKRDTQAWAKSEGWQLCRFEDNQTQNI